VIDYETYARIRDCRDRQGLTITQIASTLGLHRETVAKWLARSRFERPGFFYYSGHGASDGSTNYLIPVDVKTTESAELWDQSLRLNEITRKLKVEAGNATHFVVFDACRNTLN
jgi:transcriptional regulator with XRE-family HTH domain